MRLINAEDMIKSLMDMTYYDDEGHTIHDYEERLAIVKSFVDSVPTVEAIPIEWMLNDWDSKDLEDVGYQVMRRIIADWAERKEE